MRTLRLLRTRNSQRGFVSLLILMAIVFIAAYNKQPQAASYGKNFSASDLIGQSAKCFHLNMPRMGELAAADEGPGSNDDKPRAGYHLVRYASVSLRLNDLSCADAPQEISLIKDNLNIPPAVASSYVMYDDGREYIFLVPKGGTMFEHAVLLTVYAPSQPT